MRRSIIIPSLLLGLAGCVADPTADLDPSDRDDPRPDAGLDAPDAEADTDPGGRPLDPPAWTLCGATSECTVASLTCCGVCGAPGLGDVVGVNREQANVQRRESCGDPPPPCPACAMQQDLYLVASCDDVGFPGGNICRAHDLATSPVTACETDEDCVVRSPTCCPGCEGLGPTGYFAINRAQEAALQDVLCDESPAACDGCAPFISPGLLAVCRPGSGPGREAAYCQVEQGETGG